MFINKSIAFSQSLLGIPAGGDTLPKTKYQPTNDILRIPQVDLDCGYPKYHNFSNRSDFADMLEVCQVS